MTAFEVFFDERRPFFLEGSDIFTFGLGLGDEVIVIDKRSRRIRRTSRCA